MKTLDQFTSEYIKMKRKLGFKFAVEEGRLRNFVIYVKRNNKGIITSKIILNWANGPKSKSPSTISSRFQLVRKLAEYIHWEDSRHEVPPQTLLPSVKNFRKPIHIYSQEEIKKILEATKTFRGPMRARTYYFLFGLLACTGIRISEATSLNQEDVDFQNGTIVLNKNIKKQSRIVLLHPTTIKKLKEYDSFRNNIFPENKKTAFFVSNTGNRIHRNNASPCFDKLLMEVGLYYLTPKPRIHDLRHSFIMNTIKKWHKEEEDLRPLIPFLSTYVGHVSPSSTYWYLTSDPELMNYVSKILEKQMELV